MTTKRDFNIEEWWLLQEAPLLVGTAMIYASNSNISGTMHEIVASATAMANAGQMFPNNELIEGILRLDDDSTVYKPPIPASAGKNREERRALIRQTALDKCKRAADILEKKATGRETREYKMWVMAIGGDVATAVKEGGVLGFGAKAITEAEVKLL